MSQSAALPPIRLQQTLQLHSPTIRLQLTLQLHSPPIRLQLTLQLHSPPIRLQLTLQLHSPPIRLQLTLQLHSPPIRLQLTLQLHSPPIRLQLTLQLVQLVRNILAPGGCAGFEADTAEPVHQRQRSARSPLSRVRNDTVSSQHRHHCQESEVTPYAVSTVTTIKSPK